MHEMHSDHVSYHSAATAMKGSFEFPMVC